MSSSNAQLSQENERLRSQLTHRDGRINQLEEIIRLLRHKQFGSSSEQVPPEQERLFDTGGEVDDLEANSDMAEPIAVGAHQRKRRGRARLSDDLPRVEVVHDLAEHEKRCAEHGCELVPMGEETSEQLEFKPAELYVLRHIQKTYTCPCCTGHVVTAAKPPQPIPKSLATPSLLAWIAVSKYQDALPLYRQSAIFERLGVHLDRTTLANWMMASGTLLQPLVNLLWDQVREAALIHMDETTVQVLVEPGKTPQSKSYMWVTAAGPPSQSIVLFHYAPTRSQQVPVDLLGDYRGALMVDGYAGYEALCQQQALVRLGCWAHARRKFVEAKRAQPKGKTGKPDEALALIAKLYRLEAMHKDAASEVLYEQRQHTAVPVLAKLRRWLDKTQPRTAPGTTLGKALTYLDNQWPRLIRYVESGDYPIDNNRAENAVRPFVVGRKNWLFSQSKRGVEASANLYSLIETAKAHGLNPHQYLVHLFTELPKATTVADFENLLPKNFNNGV